MARPRKNGIAIYINGKRVNTYDGCDFTLVIRPDEPTKQELERLLTEAVKEERYEQAAIYRDKLKTITI